MTLALINGRLLEFAHIPKTGGSSVEEYMGRKGRVFLKSDEQVKWARTTPQHMPADVATAWVPREVLDGAFAIVRDPLARLISEFRMRAAPAPESFGARARAAVRSPADLLRSAPGFRAPLPDGKDAVVSFDRWAEIVLRAAAQTPHIFDNHVVPQVAFLAEGQEVFRFEDGLAPVFAWIDRVTDTEPLAPQHVNKGASFDVPVSDKTRSLVREVYAEDYAMLERLPVREADPTHARTG